MSSQLYVYKNYSRLFVIFIMILSIIFMILISLLILPIFYSGLPGRALNLWGKYIILYGSIFFLVVISDIRFIPIKYIIDLDSITLTYFNPFYSKLTIKLSDIESILWSKRYNKYAYHRVIIITKEKHSYIIIKHDFLWELFKYIPRSKFHSFTLVNFTKMEKSSRIHNELVFDGKRTDQKYYPKYFILICTLMLLLLPSLSVYIEIQFSSIITYFVLFLYISTFVGLLLYIIHILKPNKVFYEEDKMIQ